MHFLELKCINFDEDFTEIRSQVSNKQYSSSGLDNGSAPTRRQTIIWTNDVYWRLLMRHLAWMSYMVSVGILSQSTLSFYTHAVTCKYVNITFLGNTFLGTFLVLAKLNGSNLVENFITNL